MPATGPDQAKARLMSRSPLPLVPSMRFSAGTRAFSKRISAFGRGGAATHPQFLWPSPPVPPARHKAETIDQHGAGKAWIDGAQSLGGDPPAHVGEPTPAVLLGKHRERNACLVGLHIGTFRS